MTIFPMVTSHYRGSVCQVSIDRKPIPSIRLPTGRVSFHTCSSLAIEPVGIVVAIVAVILLIAAIRFAISILFRVGIVVVLVAAALYAAGVLTF